MPARKKLLVIDVAALGWDLVSKNPHPSLTFNQADTVFPAVTCVAQASFRTAAAPSEHGLVSNGLFFPELKKVLFWEQSSSLVAGPRIWDRLRANGRRVGMMFWQQSLGEDVDLVLSPRPIHKHEGGMIQDCYSQPAPLYDRLCEAVGRPFNLMHYWGPLASRKSSDWITDATCAVIQNSSLAPDLLFSYLPHLDYDLQRHGPDGKPAHRAREALYAMLTRLVETAENSGYDWMIYGDYAIGPVTLPPVLPNLALREAGLFLHRSIRGMLYPDFFSSPAFAVVDHEVAHVYVKDPGSLRRVREVLGSLQGVDRVLDSASKREFGIDHPRSGDLVLIAKAGAWFAYPWWTNRKEAPDFASHVDIHNKPGYDPCELFFGWPPMSVGTNPARIKGSHGRAGQPVAWASSLQFDFKPGSLLDLSRAVRDWCERPTE